MVSVAEQFGNLRQTLGSVLGIYAVARWLRTLIAKLTGRPPPADATALTPSNFFAFTGTAPPPGMLGPDGKPVAPRPSKKPFIVFILAVFGLPYLMGKLIKALAKSQEERDAQAQAMQGPNGQQNGSLDPSKLDFCRVLYDYPPQEALASGNFNQGLDLEVKKGDLVAVLDKSDPEGNAQNQNESQWWRCRARDGRSGYLPAVYLETIQRRPQGAITAGSASRANTMPASVSGVSLGGGVKGSEGSMPSTRAHTLTSTATGARADTMKSAASLVGAKRAPEVPLGTKEEMDQSQRLQSMQKAWVNDS